jgi:hypothetical protein
MHLCMCSLALTIEGKLSCVRFPSWCNVAFGNAFVLVPQGKLKGVSFRSWCSVFLGNGFEVVKEGNLACVRII